MNSTASSSSLAPETDPPRRLLTFWSGGWVILLAGVLMVLAGLAVLYPALATGFRRGVGDGRDPATYGFDLADPLVPREQIVAGGVAKDQIRALLPGRFATIHAADVPEIRRRKHINLLVDADRVIGLSLNGHSRAYPLRVLVQHEVVNDVLGGVPIAVSYAPLCDSVVVFDRRVGGGAAREFGVSGLLYNSNTLLYDRQRDPKAESLWCQLQFRAVTGPAKSQALTLLPYELVSWETWRRHHPETDILAGEEPLWKSYSGDPYNTYFASDALKFDVRPLWSNPNIPKKTPIVATLRPNGTWQTELANKAGPDEPGQVRIHAFLFAWYAMHGDMTLAR